VSKQVTPPPPGDRPSPTAPPPPPGWRHWLWPIALMAALVLWVVLPTVHSTPNVTLTYSQFLSDLSGHQIKTIDLAPSGSPSTGTLTDGKNYTSCNRPMSRSRPRPRALRSVRRS
jgi:cell division protease FtsH